MWTEKESDSIETAASYSIGHSLEPACKIWSWASYPAYAFPCVMPVLPASWRLEVGARRFSQAAQVLLSVCCFESLWHGERRNPISVAQWL